MSPYLRTVKTSSGATAVLLKAAARQKLAAGQGVLDLGLDAGVPGGPLRITSSRMGHLPDALGRGHDVLGSGATAIR